MDLYSLISCIPITTNCFTQNCYWFQNYNDMYIFFIIIIILIFLYYEAGKNK